MNVQKSVVVFAAMLITAAGMAAIASYSNAAVASANRGADASITTIRTLPPLITISSWTMFTICAIWAG